MKLHTMIEMYLKYDIMHAIGTINAFIRITNHINSCINCMLSLSDLENYFSFPPIGDGFRGS